MNRYISFVIALILLLGVLSGTVACSSDKRPAYAGWKTVQSDGHSVTKQKNTSGGFTYLVRIDYSDYEGEQGITPDQDFLADIFAQWLLSGSLCDYPQHFSIFDEAFLQEEIYPAMEALSMTKAQAYEKIATTARDTMGVTSCRIEYRVRNIDRSPDVMRNFKEQYASRFENVGLDINLVEDVCQYVPGDIVVIYNDIFYNDNFCDERSYPFSPYLFYQYGGKWYAAPHLLDDGMSINLLQTDPQNDYGYYKESVTAGDVTGIEGDYLVLGGSEYFLMTKDTPRVSVGDAVNITFRSIGLELPRRSDDVVCNVAVIVELEKVS